MRFPWIRAMRAGIRTIVRPASIRQTSRPKPWTAHQACGTPRLAAWLLALASAPSLSWMVFRPAALQMEPDLLGSTSSNISDPRALTSEGQRPDPIDFSSAELRELNRRFGVHGPQPRIAQLFTEGLDQLRPLADLPDLKTIIDFHAALIHDRLGRSDEAEELFRRLLGPEGGAAPRLIEAAVSFFATKGRQAEARAILERAQASYPDSLSLEAARQSLEAAAAILDGREKPTIWSPADSVVLNLLASDWDAKTHTPLFATDGPDRPDPLVITPLVYAIWEDRAEVLLKAAAKAQKVDPAKEIGRAHV